MNYNTYVIMGDIDKCPICCDRDALICLECGHSFCVYCLEDYIIGKINDSEYEIICPRYDCDKTISYNFINKYVDEDVIKKLDRNIIKETVNSSDDLKFCPKCEAICEKDDNDGVYCQNCDYTFCYNCSSVKDGEHECNFDVLDEIKDAIQREEDDDYYKSIKPCPKCHAIIHKYRGCDCVKCIICRYRFCWNCLKLAKDIQNKEEHLRQCRSYEAFNEDDSPDPSDDD
jgi:hypothetical protein